MADKRIFENDKIVVWEIVLEPGESTGVHTHSHDFLFYVTEGSTAEVTDKDGKFLGKFEMKVGDMMSFKLEGQELLAGDLRLPATHNGRNLGNKRYAEILVEMK